jgi:hypothetical protein
LRPSGDSSGAPSPPSLTGLAQVKGTETGASG